MKHNRTLNALIQILVGDLSGRKPPDTPVATPEEDFHGHLDRCAQCRHHPFTLCTTGARLLQRDALKLDPTIPHPMKPITIIEHSGDGNGVRIDNIGFVGHACDKATVAINEALGGSTSDRKNKPEYNKSVVKTATKIKA